MPHFSREMGQRGWIGMTWPKQHGGHERSALERYVVLEEMLAAGAPVALHWIADRQSGPLILRVGTDEQKKVLPRIAAGEAFFCIGMSEPDVGSDLASVRTRAAKVQGGYLVNGTKVWTSFAHHFALHDPVLPNRSAGMRRPTAMAASASSWSTCTTPGHHHPPDPRADRRAPFQRSRLQDAFLPDTALLGREGDGWNQVTSELAFERSGPERFLSSFSAVRRTGPRARP